MIFKPGLTANFYYHYNVLTLASSTELGNQIVCLQAGYP
jgi:hypothetical protein